LRAGCFEHKKSRVKAAAVDERASWGSTPSSPPRPRARAQTSDNGETVAHAREHDEVVPESQWSRIAEENGLAAGNIR
jgi:hypothetical protein